MAEVVQRQAPATNRQPVELERPSRGCPGGARSRCATSEMAGPVCVGGRVPVAALRRMDCGRRLGARRIIVFTYQRRRLLKSLLGIAAVGGSGAWASAASAQSPSTPTPAAGVELL